MKILLLAPHPFFQNRGTPIDVLILLKALCERPDVRVDVVAYPEGEAVEVENATLLRVPYFKGIKGVRPGFSFKKLLLDFGMLFYVWKLARKGNYDIIHAGEEAVFIAMLMKALYRIPYIYDLDSSIAQQMVEKYPKLSILGRLFGWAEKKAIQGALATAPVCHALSDLCQARGAGKIVVLHDISQLKDPNLPRNGLIRNATGTENLILLYCGNLEKYQGVDLLLESFPYALQADAKIDLVIIGGAQEDIARYTAKAEALSLTGRIHFLGPRPFDQLDQYLADADILVAPRIKGVNTPMKVFPYLHSGKPVLLTKLYTHTQLLTENEAYLADPEPQAFGMAIAELARDSELRRRLGAAGQAFVEKDHVYSAHKRRVDELYDWAEAEIDGQKLARAASKGAVGSSHPA